MLIMPVQVTPGEYSIFVILEDDNIARIKEHDPAEVNIHKLGSQWSKLRLRDVVIGYLAPGADTREFHRLIGERKMKEALKHLSHGFRYRPEAGDHDANYFSIKPDESETKH
jgi:hypothetical protein